MSAKICAVMQPTYLPWIGYFDLIDQADIFVFLDNVQFSKQSWQQRNRIRTKTGLQWLTVPVFSKGKLHQLVNQVTIIQPNLFPRTHLRAIEMNYYRASFFEKYFPEFKKIMVDSSELLSELNINIISWACSVMGIKTELWQSSDLGIEGKRSSLLVQICNKFNVNNYLSTMGAKEYLTEDYNNFLSHGIRILLHNYEHPEYSQVYTPFLPYAGIIDLLFNEGEHSLEIVRSGRKEPSPLIRGKDAYAI